MKNFDYQKYFIRKINEVFKQIKLSVGMPLTEEGLNFLQKNINLTNFSQIIEFKKVVLQPLNDALNANQLSYYNEQHLAFKAWNNDFNAAIQLFTMFKNEFQMPVIEYNTQNLMTLTEINAVFYSKVIVELYGKYRLQFLTFDMNQITNIIKTDFDLNIMEMNLVQLLTHQSNFVQNALKTIKELKKNDNSFATNKIDFIFEVNNYIYLLKMLLSVSYKIALENEISDLLVEDAYIYLDDFK